MKDFRPRIKGNLRKAYDNITKKETRVLVIGDLHEPFCLDGYLDHCKKTYAEYNSSYHEADPNGLGAGDELEFAIRKLKRWHNAFPKLDLTIGNHDRLIRRKAFSGGIPKQWIKEYSDVLNVKGWNFTERVVIDNVQYIHGESGAALKKAKDDMMSTVQGHRHTEMGTTWACGANFKIFGCAVGCGINHEKYAFAYGKNFKKPSIGCAVVFGGKYAINVPMDL